MSWTKEELTRHKHGPVALAHAVIKQWVKDGKPKDCDLSFWLDIIYAWNDLHDTTQYGIPSSAHFNEK